MKLAVIATAFLVLAALSPGQDVVIGSKKFTESYVLGEVLTKLIRYEGLSVEHRQGMGQTGILWAALKRGDITMYPEYTGTLWQECLKMPKKPSMVELRAACEKLGIGVSDPLGFNNTYALVMSDAKAERLGIRTMSDLAKHPELTAGPDSEFLGRKDGWGPMTAAYGLKFSSVRAIDHGLVYQAIDRGDIDLTDCYSTDAQIATFHLRVLEDDRTFFPAYKAIVLFRLDTPPKALEGMRKLEGKLDEKTMTELNAEAERTKDYAAAARLYFKRQGQPAPMARTIESEGWPALVIRCTLVHLKLVGVSLAIAILVGLPLGVLASRKGVLGVVILGFAGVVQTIPSLALLAFLVPLIGIGVWTAVIALFLYSLLPIVRNTATGLQNIPIGLRESAEALGLDAPSRLTKIYLPMASRTILAGIKTSAVINVGTATLAALIGAGGLGEPILSGLNLVDTPTILEGAIPAALLAIVVQFLFEGLDRFLIPKGLRLGGG